MLHAPEVGYYIMLKLIRLRNFQKHRLLELKLRRVTTIVGRTDVGKSAVIRALRWAFQNDAPEPGTKFFRWKAKRCSVELEIDGRAIKRSRTINGKNSYILDGKRFDVVKTTVPEEVAHVLNVNDNNFQDQHASIFWLADTPGTVSKQLNQIINLEEIDITLGRAASKLRKTKTVVATNRDRVNKSSLLKSKLKWTVDADAKLKELEALAADIEAQSQTVDTLTDLIDQIWWAEDAIREAVEFQAALIEVIEAYKQYAELSDEFESLNELVEKLEALEDAEPIDAAELIAAKTHLDEVSAECKALDDVVTLIEDADEALCKLQIQKEEAQALLSKLPITRCSKCGQIVPQ